MSPKKPIKAKNIKKMKKTTVKKVPKTDPKQQRVLKSLFKARSGKKKSSGFRRPSARPPSQRVWRRTVVRPKPKPNPNDKLPKLFRMDQETGLPVDYERTVERVMHYVNPHLVQRPNAEQVLEELLTNMFVEVVRMGSRDQQGTRHLQNLLKDQPCRLGQFLNRVKKDNQPKQGTRETNDILGDFHSAW